jgi:hypothetical protein
MYCLFKQLSAICSSNVIIILADAGSSMSFGLFLLAGNRRNYSFWLSKGQQAKHVTYTEKISDDSQ